MSHVEQQSPDKQLDNPPPDSIFPSNSPQLQPSQQSSPINSTSSKSVDSIPDPPPPELSLSDPSQNEDPSDDEFEEQDDIEYLRMLGDTLTRYRTVSRVYETIPDITPQTARHTSLSTLSTHSSSISAASQHTYTSNLLQSATSDDQQFFTPQQPASPLRQTISPLQHLISHSQSPQSLNNPFIFLPQNPIEQNSHNPSLNCINPSEIDVDDSALNSTFSHRTSSIHSSSPSKSRPDQTIPSPLSPHSRRENANLTNTPILFESLTNGTDPFQFVFGTSDDSQSQSYECSDNEFVNPGLPAKQIAPSIQTTQLNQQQNSAGTTPTSDQQYHIHLANTQPSIDSSNHQTQLNNNNRRLSRLSSTTSQTNQFIHQFTLDPPSPTLSSTISPSDIAFQSQKLTSPIIIDDSYFSNVNVTTQNTKHPQLSHDISTYGFSRNLDASLTLAPTTFNNLNSLQLSQSFSASPTIMHNQNQPTLPNSPPSTLKPSLTQQDTVSTTSPTSSQQASLTPSVTPTAALSKPFKSVGLGSSGYKPRIISSNIRPTNTPSTSNLFTTPLLGMPNSTTPNQTSGSMRGSVSPSFSTQSTAMMVSDPNSSQSTRLQLLNSSMSTINFPGTPSLSSGPIAQPFNLNQFTDLSIVSSTDYQVTPNLQMNSQLPPQFEVKRTGSSIPRQTPHAVQLLNTLQHSLTVNDSSVLPLPDPLAPSTPQSGHSLQFPPTPTHSSSQLSAPNSNISLNLPPTQQAVLQPSSQRDILIPKASSLPLNSSRFLATLSRHRTQTINADTFAEYEIVVIFPPLTWTVWRRYSEFESLYSSLLKCPEFVKSNSLTIPSLNQSAEILVQSGHKLPLPKMPPKKVFNRLSKAFISDRQALLTVWWDNLMQYIDVLLRLRPFLEFVGMVRQIETDQNKVLKHIRNNILYIDILLQHYVQEGDVFLFHTQGLLQTLQRGYLKSSYDHVGVVVRVPDYSTSPDSLYLFESTTDGVRLYPLKRRLSAWNESGAFIAYRQLHCERTHEMRYRLYHFVLENEGKEYSIGTARVWRNKYMDSTYRVSKGPGQQFLDQTISGAKSGKFTLTESTFTPPTPTSSQSQSNSQFSATTSTPVPVSDPTPTVGPSATTPGLEIITETDSTPISPTSPPHQSTNQQSSSQSGPQPKAQVLAGSEPETPLPNFPTSNISTSQLFSGSDSINIVVTSQYLSRFIKGCDFDPPIQQAQTYFCSELIAFAWLAMQIISTDRPTSSYLPVSFSDSYTKTIPFRDGVWLEQECLITFKAPEITQASLVQLGASTQNQMYAMSLLQDSLLPHNAQNPPTPSHSVPGLVFSPPIASSESTDSTLPSSSQVPKQPRINSTISNPNPPMEPSASNELMKSGSDIQNPSADQDNATATGQSDSSLEQIWMPNSLKTSDTLAHLRQTVNTQQQLAQQEGKSSALFKHQRKQLNIAKSLLQQLTPSQQEMFLSNLPTNKNNPSEGGESENPIQDSSTTGLAIAQNAFKSPPGNQNTTNRKKRGGKVHKHRENHQNSTKNSPNSPNSPHTPHHFTGSASPSPVNHKNGSSCGSSNIIGSNNSDSSRTQRSYTTTHTTSTPTSRRSPVNFDSKTNEQFQSYQSAQTLAHSHNQNETPSNSLVQPQVSSLDVLVVDLPDTELVTRNRRGMGTVDEMIQFTPQSAYAQNHKGFSFGQLGHLGQSGPEDDHINTPAPRPEHHHINPTSQLHMALVQSHIVPAMHPELINVGSDHSLQSPEHNESPHNNFFFLPSESSISASTTANSTLDTDPEFAVHLLKVKPISPYLLPSASNNVNNSHNHTHDTAGTSSSPYITTPNSIFDKTTLLIQSKDNDPISTTPLPSPQHQELHNPSNVTQNVISKPTTTTPAKSHRSHSFAVIDSNFKANHGESGQMYNNPEFFSDFQLDGHGQDQNGTSNNTHDDNADEDDCSDVCDEDYLDDCCDEDCQGCPNCHYPDEDCQDCNCTETFVYQDHDYDDIDTDPSQQLQHSPFPSQRNLNTPTLVQTYSHALSGELNDESASSNSSPPPQPSLEHTVSTNSLTTSQTRTYQQQNQNQNQNQQPPHILSDPSERPKINPFLTRPQNPRKSIATAPNNQNKEQKDIFVGPTQNAKKLREKQMLNKQKFQDQVSMARERGSSITSTPQNPNHTSKGHRVIDLKESEPPASNRPAFRVYDVEPFKNICICGTSEDERNQIKKTDHKDRTHVSFCPLYNP